MRRSILTFGLTLAVGCILSLSAQPIQPVKSETSSVKFNKVGLRFTCSKLAIDGTITTFMDHVNIDTGDFVVKDASLALYDETEKKITIFGCKEFSGKGHLIINGPDRQGNRIEHVLGSETIIVF